MVCSGTPAPSDAQQNIRWFLAEASQDERLLALLHGLQDRAMATAERELALRVRYEVCLQHVIVLCDLGDVDVNLRMNMIRNIASEVIPPG